MMHGLRLAGLGAVAVLLAAMPLAATAAPPQRIVSLNLCIDPIVLELVPRERIRALSLVSADRNVSPIAGRIEGLHLVRGGAEEVLALDPDLVLAGDFTTTATVDLLRRLGRRVEVIAMAQDIDGIRRTIREIAAAVGEPARGETMIAAFDKALSPVLPHPEKRPTAVVYQTNGIASRAGSLASAALEAAHLSNAAEHLPMWRGGRLELETLVRTPPDIVALGQPPETYRTPAADNLRHPALAHVLARRSHVGLPMPLWLCGTPHFAEAVAILARARASLMDEPH